MRVGLALREIATRDFNGFSDDPETAKVDKFKVDGSFEAAVCAVWQLGENTLLTSKLGIVGPLKELGDTSINFDNIYHYGQGGKIL